MIALVALLLAAQEFKVTQETAERAYRETRPLVEKATGVRLSADPAIRVSTPEGMSRAIAEEMLAAIRALSPGADNEAMRASIRATAEHRARWTAGLFLPGSRTIHIVDTIVSADLLRFALIHELVHASDEQAFGWSAKLREARTPDELAIWEAVIEGHAEHVTRKIMAAEKRDELLVDREAVVSWAGLSVGEAFLAETHIGSFRFAYCEGRRFFDALAAMDRPTHVEDVFRKPPATKDVILHPALYYDAQAPRATGELDGFFASFASGYRGWELSIRPTGFLEVGVSLTPFADREEVLKNARRVTAGQAACVRQGGEQGVHVVVLTMETEASAERMFDLHVRVSKAKDDRLKEGALRIVESRYKELKTKAGVRNLLSRKTLGMDTREAPVAAAYAVAGKRFIEVAYSNMEPLDADVVAELDAIVERLHGSKR